MMIRKLFTAGILFFFYTASAQELSSFEKEQWQAIEDGTPDYFALFAGVNPKMDNSTSDKYRNELDELIKSFQSDHKFLRASPSKKIKVIYKETHDRFFRKYQLENHFDEIFISGYYNCVSATAMYALIFNGLGIPYKINQKPSHVYLLAYPESENILVETTDPVNGYVQFNSAFKTQYVEDLTKAKLISEQERRTRSVDALFDQHYFLDDELTLLELAGVQYANDAIVAMNREDQKLALAQLTKAFQLYPSEQYSPVLIALNVEMLYATAYDDMKSVDYISNLSRLDSTIIKQDMLLGEFVRIADEFLVQHNDPVGLAKWFALAEKKIDNMNLLNDMEFYMNFEQARLAYNNGEYAGALGYFRICHSLQPANIEVTQNILECVRQNLISLPDQSAVADSLEFYGEQIPVLRENRNYLSMLSSSYLYNFALSFDMNDQKEGEKYKGLFEDSLQPDLQVDRDAVGRAYAIAATYYFRKGYKQKALQVLNEGLEHSPNHRELVIRKQMLN